MADSRTEFVHDLIPDECDSKMRFLLRELTLLNHHDRFSARQALGYIEGKIKHEGKFTILNSQLKDVRKLGSSRNVSG
jgi:hypothetical protein